MKKHIKLQIVKHILQHYIQRPGVSAKRLKQEKEMLRQITQQLEDIKKGHKIVNRNYKVVHTSGVECLVGANGEKHARKKVFGNFQKANPNKEYESFIKEITIEKIYQ